MKEFKVSLLTDNSQIVYIPQANGVKTANGARDMANKMRKMWCMLHFTCAIHELAEKKPTVHQLVQDGCAP